MENAAIREAILAEHDQLRAQLAAIEAQLEPVAAGDPALLAAQHGALKVFLTAFLKHVEREEQLLEPVLKDLDAWGPQRLVALQTEHFEQRALAVRLATLFPGATGPQWVEQVRAFASRLREDMVVEEHDFLDPTVLRDDVIAIDAFGG